MWIGVRRENSMMIQSFCSPIRLFFGSGKAVSVLIVLGAMGIVPMAQGAEPPTPTVPAWARSRPIYEVCLDRIPEKTFKDFETRLPTLKQLGVGILWFMPIYPRGNPPDKPKGASPYCVRDYRDVDPRYGTKDDFKHLVQEIHRAGMYVILDFVPNHTAWGNDLIAKHPEFYRKDKNGNITRTKPWPDVAQLDYSNRDLWEYMLKTRAYWLTEFDVDGFREDSADMIPAEHWTWLRPKLDAIKPVFMLAESDRSRHYPAFDLTYDATLQCYFYRIARGDLPANSLDRFLAEERKEYPPDALHMRHLSNHDMQAEGFSFFSRRHIDEKELLLLKQNSLQQKYGAGHQAFAVICATLPNSLPMIWTGQELGILGPTPGKLAWRNTPFQAFYSKLLGAFQVNPAFQYGTFVRIPSGRDDKIFAFSRVYCENHVLVVVNLSNQSQTCTLQTNEIRGEYAETFTGQQVKFARQAEIKLDPWGYQIYVHKGG